MFRPTSTGSICSHQGCRSAPEQDRTRCRFHIDSNNARQRHQNKLRKQQAFVAYGGPTCVGCGEIEDCCLSLDHVKQDGYLVRKIQGQGSSFYIWLRKNKYPEGFRVLCLNCQRRAYMGVPFPNQDVLKVISQLPSATIGLDTATERSPASTV